LVARAAQLRLGGATAVVWIGAEIVIPLFRAALELQELCVRNRWPFCFIGGLALQRWGEPRYTDDVDITLFTDFGAEAQFIDVLLKAFPERMPNAAAFALRSRVLLLRHPNGIPFDIALGGLPFEARTVERSSLWHVTDGCDLRTCCAEDLIVHKSFAARGQDWVDVEHIIQRQGEKLNTDLIIEELEPLAALKEQPEILAQLRRLLQTYGPLGKP
jgi:hypothetical protein